MKDPLGELRLLSAIPGVGWPALPGPAGGQVLGLLHQLESTQWLPPGRLRELQDAQIDLLLKHAYETVPYYRSRWASRPRAARLSELPLLPRRDLQQHFADMKSTALPPDHGATGESGSSGSTGTPVRVQKTRLIQLLWNAFTVRDHLWHQRDFGAKLGIIRWFADEEPAGGRRSNNWGAATRGWVATGPAVALGIRTDIADQLSWLQAERPAYLLTYPTLACELARLAIARGVRVPGLRELRTFSELLDPELRALAREAWDVKVTDTYSSVETGYLALQCPEAEHYHVQSEGVLIEVLDDAGKPCRPGETGRVVVTVLHNFATPLIRYELGDMAEVGDRCACGRGLPVLRRILGRTRNMLVTLSGKRYWPSFGAESVRRLGPVIQYQVAQTAPGAIEARLVVSAPPTPEQEEKLKAHFASRVPEGATVTLRYPEKLARSASGKFEEFVSEIPR